MRTRRSRRRSGRSILRPTTPRASAATCQVKSNVKSRPGVMTVRGCAYAGAKGVVWGPVKDQITISHGPIGCGQYSWWSRRNYYNGQTGIDAFGTMHITTDFQEKDIVYGGDKGLDAGSEGIERTLPARHAASASFPSVRSVLSATTSKRCRSGWQRR